MKHDDILDYLLKNEDSRYKLNDKEILDQVIMILYSGFETMSTTSMMAIKYLHDHPAALQELRVSKPLFTQFKIEQVLLTSETNSISYNSHRMSIL